MQEKVIKILTEFTDVPYESITGDSRLVGDLGITSLDVVGILSRLEEEFRFNIDESADFDFQTVNDVVSFLNSNNI